MLLCFASEICGNFPLQFVQHISSVEMANRGGDMGVDYALGKKMAGKYDPAMEAEVVNWIQQVTGDKVNTGMQGFQQSLKDGILLLK